MQPSELQALVELANRPFYAAWDFWIGAVLGGAGVAFSLLSFREARKAKIAAAEAGQIVKIQTITIELSEIAQRLDKLDSQLSFAEARDSLNEISRRLRRLIAPFQEVSDLKAACQQLKSSLEAAKESLDNLLPQDGNMETLPPNSVYFATQSHLSNISGLVAEIMGLFEKRTIKVEGQ